MMTDIKSPVSPPSPNAPVLIINGVWQWSIILGLLLTVGFIVKLDFSWGLGALLGTIIVALNLYFLKKAVYQLSTCQLTSKVIKIYLLYFALAFLATMGLVAAILTLKIAHPIAFLAGLTIMWLALFPAVVSFLIKNNFTPKI